LRRPVDVFAGCRPLRHHERSDVTQGSAPSRGAALDGFGALAKTGRVEAAIL